MLKKEEKPTPDEIRRDLLKLLMEMGKPVEGDFGLEDELVKLYQLQMHRLRMCVRSEVSFTRVQAQTFKEIELSLKILNAVQRARPKEKA